MRKLANHSSLSHNGPPNQKKMSTITVIDEPNNKNYYEMGAAGNRDMKTVSRAKKIQASTKVLQPKKLHKDPSVK